MKGITLILLFVSFPPLFANVIISPSLNPPVELSSFTGQVEDGNVHLFWNTASEINNLGFAIERSAQIGQWKQIGFVEGRGTTNEPQTYEFIDSLFNIVAEKIHYRLKQIDYDGSFQYSGEIEIVLQQITLRDTTNQYDYIIITVPEFVNACEPFRQHKELVRDFRTLIVDTTQIYAEFDSSAAPQDNIRDFISYAGTFWKEPRLKFFLIVGTITNVPNFDIPFPGQPGVHFKSDYYYNLSIYENDSTTTDFYIGRVPVKTNIELNNYLSKVMSYENLNTLESWMNNSLFICADDINFEFFNAAWEVSEHFANYMRSYFIVDTDTSAYYGNLDSIYNAIEDRGASFLWFEGHVTDSGFGNPNWFYLEDLNGLSNYNKYFLTFFASSQYSIIDSNTNFTSQLMFLQDAGSIGGIAFVGPAYWGTGQTMQHLWAERLFDQSIQSVGESFVSDDISPSGLYNYMKKIANLWADPSLKLKYDTTVGVEKVEEEIPTSFTIYQNYPNPFNPTTTIKFALPVESKVKINVYNSLGQLVETLVDQDMQSGYHEINFDASRLASGVYLYQLLAGEYVSVKKMLLIK